MSQKRSVVSPSPMARDVEPSSQIAPVDSPASGNGKWSAVKVQRVLERF
jgi:hypothetical protein